MQVTRGGKVRLPVPAKSPHAVLELLAARSDGIIVQ